MRVNVPLVMPFNSKVPFADTSAVMVVPSTITVTFWALALDGFAPEEAPNVAPSPSTRPWTATPPAPDGDDGLSLPQAIVKAAAATATHASKTRRFMATSGTLIPER
jgi:hypothetical protein